MSKKYNLNIEEILQILQNNKRLSEAYTGFSEKELIETENRLGVKLPDIYRNYMMHYGKHNVNDIFNHICSPAEIQSNYVYLEEYLEDYVENKNSLPENKYDLLYRLPKNKWNEISEEYIIIWYENQGVWYAGYLKEDLKKGIDNPPVYISIDNFFDFEKASANTENFLKEMLFFAAWESGFDSIEQEKNILSELEQANINPDLLFQHNINTFFDSETNQFYFYLSSNHFQVLLVNCNEDDEI